MGRAFIIAGPGTDRRMLDIPSSWVRGVAFPRNDAPDTDQAATVTYHNNPLFILPREHRGVYELIVACRGTLGQQLRRLVRARPDAAEKAFRFVCALRAFRTLAGLHADHGSTGFSPPGTPLDQHKRNTIHARANTLQRALEDKENLFEDPMPYTHPHLLRGLANTGTALLRELGRAERARSLTRFLKDGSIAKTIRYMYLRVAHGSVSGALNDLAETIRFSTGPSGNIRRGAGGLAWDGLMVGYGVVARLAREHQGLRSADRSQRMAELNNIDFEQALSEAHGGDGSGGVVTATVTGMGIFAAVYGNVGYGDALMMGIAKVAAARVLMSDYWRPRISRNNLLTLERAIIADIPSQTARSRMHDHFRNPSEANRNAVRETLGEHFQTGARLNLAVTACACVQLAFVMAAANEDGRITPDEQLDIFEAGIGAGTSVYTLVTRHVLTVDRMQAAFRNLERVIGRRAAGVAGAGMRGVDSFVSGAERPVNGFFAVIAIAKGYVDLMEAYEANDLRAGIVAGFTFASGLATAGGVFLEIPYGQPVGVVLMIVGAVIGTLGYLYDETRPPLGKEFLMLARIIERTHDRHNELIDRSEFSAIKTAYERVLAEIGYQEFKLYFRDDDSYRDARRLLHDIGYPYRPYRRPREEGTVYVDDLTVDPTPLYGSSR